MAPVSMRKEIGFPATVRVTLGSVEVMRVRDWGPGHLQSSVVSPRRLGRAGLEDSCSGPGGDVQIPGGGFGQSLYATAGSWTWRRPWLQAWVGPVIFFAAFEAGPRWLPFFVG